MTHTASNGEARSTRYHVSHPPRMLYGVLTALAKDTRSAEYRRHGGHPDPNWIRSIVKRVTGNHREADADEIRRFLLNEGVLVESEGKGWAFDPAKADDLYRRCGEKDAALVRGTKTFVEMCERSSDPPGGESDPAEAEERRCGEKERLEHEHEELELELQAKRKALATHNTY